MVMIALKMDDVDKAKAAGFLTGIEG